MVHEFKFRFGLTSMLAHLSLNTIDWI